MPTEAQQTMAPLRVPQQIVAAPTGAATDVVARFPADGGRFLELRKVDASEPVATEVAIANAVWMCFVGEVEAVGAS